MTHFGVPLKQTNLIPLTNRVNCHQEILKLSNLTLIEFQPYNVNDIHHEDVLSTLLLVIKMSFTSSGMQISNLKILYPMYTNQLACFQF